MSSVSQQSLQQALQHHFGYSTFRPGQESIIRHIISGQDSLVLMPTGGGKSICYQLPALVLEGVTIVVSPLIALMKDQVDALRQNGIKAAFLNSTQSQEEQNGVLWQLRAGELRLLYVAPERLIGEARFVDFLKRVKVALLAIDEAHCISQWGHDFRPEYLALGELKTALPGVPIVALTATADKLTKDDIIKKLRLTDYKVFEHSFNRPNIYYQVLPKKRPVEQIVQFLKAHKEDSGIIYCLSRNNTEALAENLQKAGYNAVAYHAGLEKGERDKRQEQFLRDDVRIVVATIAFGMGIDKSNVRYVIHADMPKNIEGYYQETGRAGRDGLPSDAVLLYSFADVTKLRGFCNIPDNLQQTRILERKLDEMARFCTITSCRRKYLLNYFGEEAPDNCGSCDVCQTTYERADATIPAQMMLSAVARLDGRFGLHYIVEVLKGNAAKVRPEHQSLKTFGVGADSSKAQWLNIGRELIQLGYLKQTADFYPVVHLTDKSWAVLKGEEKVLLVSATKVLEDKPAKASPAAAQVAYPALFEKLRTLRKRLADEQNVPAFTIFSDASLVELASYLPLDERELLQISGFGDAKLERYGEAFLDVLRSYAIEHNLQSRIGEKAPKKAKRERSLNKESSSSQVNSITYQQTLDLFHQGFSIPEIAEMRGKSEATVREHLAAFILSGEIPIRKLVKEDRLALILPVIQEKGAKMLRPIKDALPEYISYDEIRFATAHWERMQEG